MFSKVTLNLKFWLLELFYLFYKVNFTSVHQTKNKKTILYVFKSQAKLSYSYISTFKAQNAQKCVETTLKSTENFTAFQRRFDVRKQLNM